LQAGGAAACPVSGLAMSYSAAGLS